MTATVDGVVVLNLERYSEDIPSETTCEEEDILSGLEEVIVE